jgi:hypothetical protein
MDKKYYFIQKWLLVEPNSKSSQGKNCGSTIVSIFPFILKEQISFEATVIAPTKI